MENLTDPSKLGAGIAVAFVATIYGVAFANLVFLPIGNALKAAVGAEIHSMEIAAECLIDLAKGRAPRDIEMRIAISIAED
jgi:chemotaxis protein MotA